MEEPKDDRLENGFSDPVVSPDEPKSEPLPETPSLLPTDSNGLKSILCRQQSLVILTGQKHTLTRTHTLLAQSYILVDNVLLQSQSRIKSCQSPL